MQVPTLIIIIRSLAGRPGQWLVLLFFVVGLKWNFIVNKKSNAAASHRLSIYY